MAKLQLQDGLTTLQHGLHDKCVAQVRVAYALVPYQGNAAQSLLSRLETRLAQAASSDDKRAVFAL